MKLYYKPGACSMAVHIVLQELGEDFELEQVDLATKRTESGRDFLEVNPNGYVPALALDDGDVLLEVQAILQHLADRRPDAGLAPAAGTRERTRLQQYLAFVSSELHKSFSPLFGPQSPEGAARDAVVEKIRKRFGYLDSRLADGRAFLLGEGFTAVDAYAFVMGAWARRLGIDLSDLPHLAGYLERLSKRPAVLAALRREGLLG